jgi:hypothetical protein
MWEPERLVRPSFQVLEIFPITGTARAQGSPHWAVEKTVQYRWFLAAESFNRNCDDKGSVIHGQRNDSDRGLSFRYIAHSAVSNDLHFQRSLDGLLHE